MRTLVRDSLELRYEVHGGSGPALLLPHLNYAWPDYLDLGPFTERYTLITGSPRVRTEQPPASLDSPAAGVFILDALSAFLNIGDFSRMTFLGVKTLRYYHDIGLLSPAEVDPDTGYRRYALGQVPTAQVIRRLRELGMSIEEVRGVIEAGEVSVRNAAIAAHLQRMEGELERTRETVKALRLLLDEDAPSIIAVEYRVVGPTEALAIRGRLAYADAFDWLDGAFNELRSAFVDSGVRRAGANAALYSNELLEDEFGELTAVIPVTGTARPSGRAETLVLPRTEYAIAVHTGSVADIDRTYAALGAVVAERSIGVQGPIREDYLVGANDTDDETRYRTEICWPVFQTTAG